MSDAARHTTHARAGIARTFADGVVIHDERTVRSRACRTLPVSFNAVFRDAGGRVAGILAAARDVTPHEQIRGDDMGRVFVEFQSGGDGHGA